MSRKGRKKEEAEEEEKIPFSYSGKPKGGDDYPDEGGEIIFTRDKPLPDDDEDLDKSFVTARDVSRKNSDDYRMEIALLESKRDKLMKDIETLELEFPKMEEYRQEFATHLLELKEEIDLLEDIESSAKKDREKMENKYETQKKEAPPPPQGMQTRSQGPPSYGEKFHQEEYDPLETLHGREQFMKSLIWGNIKHMMLF